MPAIPLHPQHPDVEIWWGQAAQIFALRSASSWSTNWNWDLAAKLYIALTHRTISPKPKVCLTLEQGTQFSDPAKRSQMAFSI
jgi:hypothetical protein